MMEITGIDHVQLAMPAGREAEARAFYGGLLGLPELTKPVPLQARGGCWFAIPGSQLHMGVEAEFLPQRKAHPALLVRDLEACRAELAATGVPIVPDATLPNVRRFYASDPFGNRLEFIQEGDGFASLPERLNLPGS
ncbi:MAG TPA: VOC family protein [Kouleothrix sp.]|jgi:catechol 2,3-dioxygenase-like lactoylglutathione lyase family enzyme|nr:VOC family protein [Kouleothrix sp.]